MLGLQDIAKELNVSVSLVSKVLNGRLGTTGVSPGTVDAIRQKAQTLGYRKNRSAAALATGKQNVIGVFFHRIGSAGSGIMESVIGGIAAEADRYGQGLRLNFYETAEQFAALKPQIHRNVLDGLIVGGISHRELLHDLTRLQEQGVPVVTMFDRPLAAALPNVCTDQVEVGRLATRHLIERGCRRLAHLRVNDERFRGYQLELEASGVGYRPELALHVHSFEYSAGEAAMAHFATAGIDFDGVVAQSDQQAMAVFNSLARLGINVPGQVRIIGVDNAPFCELNLVPLSSVSQQDLLRGQKAVQLLLGRIKGRAVENISIPPALWPRESSR